MELLEVEMPVRTDADLGTNNDQNGEKLIRFTIGENNFCVRAAAVVEVVLPLTVSRVPNSPGWLRGIAGCRGDLVAVIEPSKVPLGCESVKTDGQRALVFHPIAGSNKLALPVDSVVDLFDFPVPNTPGGPDNCSPVSKMVLPDGEIAMLDPESLLKFLSQRSM